MRNKVGPPVEGKEGKEEDMNKTLSMLENDGYIMRIEGGRRVFRSPILRDYWKHTFID